MRAIKKAVKVIGWAGAAAFVHMQWRAMQAAHRSTDQASAELQRLQSCADAHAETAARIDHDFRTPIGTLMSAIELIRAQPDDAALRAEALDVMTRQAARMTALTESLRTLAHELAEASPR